jgi:hypothetical protein
MSHASFEVLTEAITVEHRLFELIRDKGGSDNRKLRIIGLHSYPRKNSIITLL